MMMLFEMVQRDADIGEKMNAAASSPETIH
jgi:hypothetical protein